MSDDIPEDYIEATAAVVERMCDDEVCRLADDLLREAADAIEFPEHVRVQDLGDALTFILTLESAEIAYKPQADAERIVRRCEEGRMGSFDRVPEPMRSWLLRSAAGTAIKRLLANFHLEFTDLLSDLPLVAESQSDMLIGIMATDSEEGRSSFEPKPGRLRLVGQQLRNRERRFLGMVDERKNLLAPTLLLIADLHELLYPVWRKVKKSYTRFRGISRDWKEHFMREIERYNLPSDLIDRFIAGHEEDGDSYGAEPSLLAIEQSARICGAAKNQFSERKLRLLLKESKVWKDRRTQQEYEAEVVRFAYMKQEHIRTSEAASENSA